jgi:hypothetical protein
MGSRLTAALPPRTPSAYNGTTTAYGPYRDSSADDRTPSCTHLESLPLTWGYVTSSCGTLTCAGRHDPQRASTPRPILTADR